MKEKKHTTIFDIDKAEADFMTGKDIIENEPCDVTISNRAEFESLIRSTNRCNTEKLLDYLEQAGFYTAPASRMDHLNIDGGLLQHSLNVYQLAMRIWEQLSTVSDMNDVNRNNIVIASLLHDVCKADRYIKQVDGSYLKNYSNFPAGHGEKSVIQLLRIGFPLTEAEILAIEYHMGAFRLPLHSEEADKDYRAACSFSPLVSIIHCADTLASNIIEIQQKVQLR